MGASGYANLNLEQKYLFWDKNPLMGAYEMTIPGCSRFRMYSENDDTVIKELHWTGYTGWEFCSLLLWSHFCKRCTARFILDIGSYTGIYSLLAVAENSASNVMLFDIQSRCIDRAERNILENGFDNITANLLAPHDENGSIEFYTSYEPKIIRSVASLKPNKYCNTASVDDSVRLDDFLKNSLDRVSLVKIDVEGAEKSVLGGMQDILSLSAPNVLCEINDPGTAWNIKQEFFPEKYRMYSVDDNRLNFTEIVSSEFQYVGRNYLFSIHEFHVDFASMVM